MIIAEELIHFWIKKYCDNINELKRKDDNFQMSKEMAYSFDH